MSIREPIAWLTGPPDVRDAKSFYYLEVRWNGAIEDRLDAHPMGTGVGLSQVIEDSLRMLHMRYRKGRLGFQESSDFLQRLDKDDKHTHVVCLHREVYHMLRNLAFTMHLFMAEVVRLALEWYLFFYLSRDKHERKIYFLKNYYMLKMPVPAVIAVALFRLERQEYLMYDTLPSFSVTFGDSEPE